MTAQRRTRKSARKTSAARKKSPIQRLEDELMPADLRGYSRRVRAGLTRLERQIDRSRRDARRRFTRLLREVSHQLGRFEAEGEKRWRQRATRARRDAAKLLRRLERAIEPPKAAPRKRKTAARSKTTRTRKAAARPVSRPAAPRRSAPARVAAEPASEAPASVPLPAAAPPSELAAPLS